MKLIDLLVQELPKRGGWPAEYNVISTNGYGQVWCYSINISGKTSGKELYIHSSEEGHVTREQYEAALAAAQQPVWNGEGLPPVGCVCEGKQRGQINWTKFTVVAIANDHVFGFWNDNVAVGLSPKMWEFRPIRSEADKKRDAVIEALKYYVRPVDASDLYDAIVAGEVKGLKLE